MALCKTGGGVTDISGTTGGVYFHRDRTGLHSCKLPRTVKKLTPAQKKQRNAFRASRTFCMKKPSPAGDKDFLNRCVSYNIHRHLNQLELETPPPDYNPPGL